MKRYRTLFLITAMLVLTTASPFWYEMMPVPCLTNLTVCGPVGYTDHKMDIDGAPNYCLLIQGLITVLAVRRNTVVALLEAAPVTSTFFHVAICWKHCVMHYYLYQRWITDCSSYCLWCNRHLGLKMLRRQRRWDH